MKVNLFKDLRDCSPKLVTFEEVVDMIREDAAVKDRTERHRYYLSQSMKKAATAEKLSCPCFSVATLFDGGKTMKDICGWTGIGMVDVDDVDADALPRLSEVAAADVHTLLVYTTISGGGLRILFRYRTDAADDADFKQQKLLYEAAFEMANAYYRHLMKVVPDPKCKTCTQVSAMAHDPGASYRPEAEPFVVSLSVCAEQAKHRKAQQKLLRSAVKAAHEEITAQGVDFRPGSHNEYVMRMGYLLNVYGVDEEVAAEWAVKQFAAEYHDNIEGVIRSCYKHTEEHASRRLPKKDGSDSEENRWASVTEIEQFLSSQVELRFNVIRRQCELKWRDDDGGRVLPRPYCSDVGFSPITDRDENTLWCRMKKEQGNVRLQDIRNVLHSEFVPLFNPFEAYFYSLPPWDGEDHIGRLASTVHVKGDQERFVEYFRKWLVGILPTLFEPDVVNHEIMVFIGRQGNFKSTFFSLLLPPELQSYFQVKLNHSILTKDDILTMSEFALVCLEEIDELRPSELNQLKAIVTTKSISERAAYARNKEQRPHIASFCATGNNPHFLTDPTANRRWLVMEVENIDDPHLHPFNYTGIYSQAMALWKNGFRYWFNQKEIKKLNTENREYEAPNLEEELVLTYFRQPFEGCKASFMKVAEVLERINGGIRQPLSPIKLGMVMNQLGFPSVKRKGIRGYLVIERTANEIQSSRRIDGSSDG